MCQSPLAFPGFWYQWHCPQICIANSNLHRMRLIWQLCPGWRLSKVLWLGWVWVRRDHLWWCMWRHSARDWALRGKGNGAAQGLMVVKVVGVLPGWSWWWSVSVQCHWLHLWKVGFKCAGRVMNYTIIVITLTMQCEKVWERGLKGKSPHFTIAISIKNSKTYV